MPRANSKPRRNRRKEIQTPPTIGEIQTVLEDHIQTLIESFAVCPPGKEATLAMVEVPTIRREIAAVRRALVILEWVKDLDLEALKTANASVPRGTQPLNF